VVYDVIIAGAGEPHWVASWATSQQPAQKVLPLGGHTVRQRVHLSLAGARVRVRLSNRYGPTPLRVGAAAVATAAAGGAIVDGSARPLRFGGGAGVVIPAGGETVSDPLTLATATRALAIDLHLPDAATIATTEHTFASATSWDTAGNLVGAHALAGARTTTRWYFIDEVDVDAPAAARAVVAFGDSLTDGMESTTDENRRWPDELGARLAERRGPPRAVVNGGIAGNGLLRGVFGDPMVARFDHDVLGRAGVGYVVVLGGINDIALPLEPNENRVTAQQLIAAQQQLVARAHARGVKVVGATLTPFEATQPADAPLEAIRQAFNEWVREGGAFDGVVDFDRALRDPARPGSLRRDFDSGDHAHPNDAGYAAMAAALDLALFDVR
jgi:lysophospholipase L1-like esterase